MSTKQRPKGASTPDLASAARVFVRAYFEGGNLGKRGALQAEAWRRLKTAAHVQHDERKELQNDRRRKVRAKDRRDNYTQYSTDRVNSWFWDRMRELAAENATIELSDEAPPKSAKRYKGPVKGKAAKR